MTVELIANEYGYSTATSVCVAGPVVCGVVVDHQALVGLLLIEFGLVETYNVGAEVV